VLPSAISSNTKTSPIAGYCPPPQEFFDVKRFINATEDRPPLWNSRCTDYDNCLMKQECWKEVCREMKEDFDAPSKEKQNEIRT
jgi:hypothetical protein